MTKLCESLISKDISFDCNDMSVKGLEADGVILNRDDIDFSKCTFDETAKNILTQIVLKSGKKGYQVLQMGNTPFTGTTTTLAVGTYRNTWTNEIPIAVLNNTPEVAEKIIDGLANGTFVLILRNKAKGTDGKAEYQVFGFYQGMVASAGTNEKYSDETEGGWLMTLQETNAPKSALFLFNTSSEATAAAYNSLLTATA